MEFNELKDEALQSLLSFFTRNATELAEELPALGRGLGGSSIPNELPLVLGLGGTEMISF